MAQSLRELALKRSLQIENPSRNVETDKRQKIDSTTETKGLYKPLEEEMFQRALDGYEKALGPDHTSTLDTVHSLGNLYVDQGKLKEAEEMYQRALKGYEKTLGLDHTSTLAAVHNLGLLFKGQCKLKEAEEMYHRSLKGFERALIRVAEVFPFPEHKNRATWTIYLPHAQRVLSCQEYSSDVKESQQDLLFNVGECFRISGKYAEAEQMYRQALELSEKVLGQEHPSTLSSMNNLTLVLQSQGKYTEAEGMHLQALELNEKVLGQEHPSTLGSMNNLALVLRGQGKYEEAETILHAK